MKFEHLTIKDLRLEARASRLWQSAVIPISRQRLVSQIHNPRAEDQDVALILAIEGGDVAGYIGMLPDLLHFDGGQIRMAWLSTWYVSPAMRIAGIGPELLLKSYAAYNGFVAAADTSPISDGVYAASRKFETWLSLPGVEFRLLVDHPDPSRPGWWHAPFTLARWVIDPAMAAAQRFFPHVRTGEREGVGFEHLPAMDEELEKYVESVRNPEISLRRSPEFNWILAHPWIMESPVADRASTHYYFSSVAQRFAMFFIKMRSAAGDTVGCALVRILNDRVFLPYVFLTPEWADHLMGYVFDLAVEARASRISFHCPRLIAASKRGRFPRLWSSRITRRSIISHKIPLQGTIGRIFHAGDGDGVFA